MRVMIRTPVVKWSKGEGQEGQDCLRQWWTLAGADDRVDKTGDYSSSCEIDGGGFAVTRAVYVHLASLKGTAGAGTA
jgi:hypothetical protein